MDRRPLSLLLALGLLGTVPAGAAAASAEALFAATPSGTLSEDPVDTLTAQTPEGTLSDEPQEAPTSSTPAAPSDSSSGSARADADGTLTATADALPFTGSDPRITMLLGLAALLAGAGLRMRTAHPHDF